MSEPTPWLEIAKIIPGLFTAGAAIYGARIAKRGLDKWKIETVGKRRAELAEQALVVAYEARDILKLARADVTSRRTKHDEAENVSEVLDRLEAPIECLLRHAGIFAKLRALIYPIAAHFGQEKTRPFHTIVGIHDDIADAARKLMARVKNHSLTPESASSIEILFGRTEDNIDRALDQAIADIEALCRPALTEAAIPDQ